MTVEYPAVSPYSSFDNKNPLPGFLRRLGLDGGLMAARGAEGDNEVGDETMDDDWAGALPAAAGPRDASPEEPKIIKEHGDPHAMAPENGRMPCTLTSPIRPSAEDVAKHYVAHMPPRSWCSICNAANLKGRPA